MRTFTRIAGMFMLALVAIVATGLTAEARTPEYQSYSSTSFSISIDYTATSTTLSDVDVYTATEVWTYAVSSGPATATRIATLSPGCHWGTPRLYNPILDSHTYEVPILDGSGIEIGMVVRMGGGGPCPIMTLGNGALR